MLMLILSALLVGLSLGVMGAGGSIIAVPLLMLLVDMSEKAAIKHALLIVSVIALAGALKEIFKRRIRFPMITSFGLASIPASSLGAYVGYALMPGVQTVVLVAVMLLAATRMLLSRSMPMTKERSVAAVLAAGFGAGFVTGLVGVGGGFLIVPALVLFVGLSMQQAVSHSLILIFINALVAFATLQSTADNEPTNWTVIGMMVSIGIVALLVGQAYMQGINQSKLKKVFAICLVLVAAGLLVQQF